MKALLVFSLVMMTSISVFSCEDLAQYVNGKWDVVVNGGDYDGQPATIFARVNGNRVTMTARLKQGLASMASITTDGVCISGSQGVYKIKTAGGIASVNVPNERGSISMSGISVRGNRVSRTAELLEPIDQRRIPAQVPQPHSPPFRTAERPSGGVG